MRRFIRINSTKQNMNKKGIEMQMSFIVMLILAIVVFAFGLVFVRNLFTTAGDIKAQLSQDAEQRIDLMLDRGERLAIPITARDVKSDEVATYGLGILNLRGQQTNFYISIACTVALDNKEKDLGAEGCSGDWTFQPDPITLKNNEKDIIPIAVHAIGSKPKGTYGFTIKVTIDSPDGEIYTGSPKQIYLNII